MGSVRMRDADEDSVIVISDDSDAGEELLSDSGGAVAGHSSDTGAYGADADSEAGASSGEADLGVLEDGNHASSRKGPGYRVITQESLKKLQRAAIDDVASIWGCAPSIAKTLLMAYMWDKERLLSELCLWLGWFSAGLGYGHALGLPRPVQRAYQMHTTSCRQPSTT